MTKEHKAEVAKIVRKLRRFGMAVERSKSISIGGVPQYTLAIRPLQNWKRKTIQTARAFLGSGGIRKLCKFSRIATQQANHCSDLLESMDYKLRKYNSTHNFDYVKFVDEDSDKLVVFAFNGD